jgi:hypothetical protein
MVLPQQPPVKSLSGPLGFPVTPFRLDDREPDLPPFRQHLAEMPKAGPPPAEVAPDHRAGPAAPAGRGHTALYGIAG